LAVFRLMYISNFRAYAAGAEDSSNRCPVALAAETNPMQISQLSTH